MHRKPRDLIGWEAQCDTSADVVQDVWSRSGSAGLVLLQGFRAGPLGCRPRIRDAPTRTPPRASCRRTGRAPEEPTGRYFPPRGLQLYYIFSFSSSRQGCRLSVGQNAPQSRRRRRRSRNEYKPVGAPRCRQIPERLALGT
ncbi:unnamed protein product [Merluccius merluccius]